MKRKKRGKAFKDLVNRLNVMLKYDLSKGYGELDELCEKHRFNELEKHVYIELKKIYFARQRLNSLEIEFGV